jgi:hypothetical protein
MITHGIFQGARFPAERGVLQVRRSERGMKRNAEIGLSTRRPRLLFLSTPPGRQPAAFKGQDQGARFPAERGVLQVRRSERGMKRNAEIDLSTRPAK